MTLVMKVGPVTLGASKVTVNCNDFSFDKVETLRESVAQVRRNHTIFAKYPMNEGEKKEIWRTRVEPEMEADLTRKEGETPVEHLKRLAEFKSDTHEMAPEMLNAICSVFGLRDVPIEDFRQANWLEAKGFIYDVLNLVDIPAEDFAPKKPLGPVAQ